MLHHIQLLIPFIILTSFSGFGQESRLQLNGRVYSAESDVSNLLIINLNSQKSTITDSYGSFTIEVELRDSLRITALQYLTKEVIITDSILRKKQLLINLVENVINLNEVTVMPYNLSGKINLDIDRLNLTPVVNSYSLGLPNANLEVLTQSERLLLEADRGKYVNYYGTALTINTHKIMNKLSGRTRSFENRVARDEKMQLEREIIAKFSKKSISESFNIPETNIDGFLTYCLSQTDFIELQNAANNDSIWIYLKAKSIEYKR